MKNMKNMKEKKIKRYNIDNIRSKDAKINWILGERSNGKSYQVKMKIIFDEYFESVKNNPEEPHRSMLVRRRKDEISITYCQDYFNDFRQYIYDKTEGEYDRIIVKTNRIYLARRENGKDILGDHIGYKLALIDEQDTAGTSYLDVYNIIMEEIITRSTYLGTKEPDKLMNLYATIDRKRNVVKLWCLGNTISKFCPYFKDWGLDNYLYKMKQGDIVTYEVQSGIDEETGKPILIKVAIEYTGPSGTSSYTIGSSAKMMSDGSWQVDIQPKLKKSIKDYKYTGLQLYFTYKQFTFKARLYKDKDFLFFITPSNEKRIKKKDILFTDEVFERILTFTDPYNMNIQNKNLINIINNYFVSSKIFYCTDEVGTDFKQAINFKIKNC